MLLKEVQSGSKIERAPLQFVESSPPVFAHAILRPASTLTLIVHAAVKLLLTGTVYRLEIKSSKEALEKMPELHHILCASSIRASPIDPAVFDPCKIGSGCGGKTRQSV